MFQSLDVRGVGFIERRDVKTAATQASLKIRQDAIDGAVRLLDRSGVGRLTYRDFLAACSKAAD
jgi:Ca2+-binding EF-hand superfamily protein